MAYYKYHIFFCLNQRNENEQCCNNFGAEDKFNYMKKKLKSLNLYGVNMSRVNRAGCFNRCQEGPLLVIYPEETWYRCIDNEDIDEIIESHLEGGKVVERLIIK